MRARQIAGAHQEFADDLPAHELEGLPEQPDPLLLRQRMVLVDPGGEGTVFGLDCDHAAGIFDHRGNLEAVADDSRIPEQPHPVLLVEAGDDLRIEAAERLVEGRPLLQHRQPGKARLVDLQRQALEKHGIIAGRKAVFPVVIGAVPGMAWRNAAIAHLRVRACGMSAIRCRSAGRQAGSAPRRSPWSRLLSGPASASPAHRDRCRARLRARAGRRPAAS